MGRPQINFFLAKDCLYRQDKLYERRTIKVMLTGSRANFYLQEATTSTKIWDYSRIHESSFKEIIERFNKIKKESE